MPTAVILSQGTRVRISTAEIKDVQASPNANMIELDCIGREFSVQGGSATEIDITTVCSTVKEFRLGLQDSGSMTITGHWVQGHPGQVIMRTAAADKKTRLLEIAFPNNSAFRCLVLVQQRSFTFGVDSVVSATFVLRLTGPTDETDAAYV